LVIASCMDQRNDVERDGFVDLGEGANHVIEVKTSLFGV
jgi:hypothetical protein